MIQFALVAKLTAFAVGTLFLVPKGLTPQTTEAIVSAKIVNISANEIAAKEAFLIECIDYTDRLPNSTASETALTQTSSAVATTTTRADCEVMVDNDPGFVKARRQWVKERKLHHEKLHAASNLPWLSFVLDKLYNTVTFSSAPAVDALSVYATRIVKDRMKQIAPNSLKAHIAELEHQAALAAANLETGTTDTWFVFSWWYPLYALLAKLGWDFYRWNLVDWGMRFFVTSDREPSRSEASHSSGCDGAPASLDGMNAREYLQYNRRLKKATKQIAKNQHNIAFTEQRMAALGFESTDENDWIPVHKRGKPRAVTYTTNRGTEKEETSGHEERRLALCNSSVVCLDPRETDKALPAQRVSFKLSREAQRDLAEWGY